MDVVKQTNNARVNHLRAFLTVFPSIIFVGILQKSHLKETGRLSIDMTFFLKY